MIVFDPFNKISEQILQDFHENENSNLIKIREYTEIRLNKSSKACYKAL